MFLACICSRNRLVGQPGTHNVHAVWVVFRDPKRQNTPLFHRKSSSKPSKLQYTLQVVTLVWSTRIWYVLFWTYSCQKDNMSPIPSRLFDIDLKSDGAHSVWHCHSDLSHVSDLHSRLEHKEDKAFSSPVFIWSTRSIWCPLLSHTLIYERNECKTELEAPKESQNKIFTIVVQGKYTELQNNIKTPV